MPPTTDTSANFIPRLVWASSGDLKSPTHEHEEVLRMLRWGSGVDVRANTVRYVIDHRAKGQRLSQEQKMQVKEELEKQIKAAFHGKKEPLPVVCFPSGQQFDSRMVDIYCSPKGEVNMFQLNDAAGQFTYLGRRGLGFKRHYGADIERNEQLLRIKGLGAEHLDAFVADREALLRDVVGLDAHIKDIWALDKADESFSEQVDVLIALPDEVDAVTAAHDWPGWLLWKGILLELAYRNRFAYCSHCKNAGGTERHLRKHCEVSPPTRADEEDPEDDDVGPERYDDDYDSPQGEILYEDEDFWYTERGPVYKGPAGFEMESETQLAGREVSATPVPSS